ncbi:MAG: tRNA (adenosine(37)-N6)-threonylcarbamoyltransferase complex transferase subunit TsaD [Saprospiraceae bacterium]
MDIFILGIESSCDDTAAAVFHNGRILSNFVANQEIHEQYGGVVPEVASRAHQINIVPVVDRALKQAGIGVNRLNAIAFTRGPGLMGSLLVGVSFAKALALSLKLPLVEVNHMEAHVLAHFAEPPYPPFPFLCLTVSGGHTQILRVDDHFSMEILGETLDDAAGEAFDKTGKLLGLGYPAGPAMDRLAREGTPRFEFPEPQIKGLDFSFSGLKTAVLYFLKKEMGQNPNFIQENLADLCASIQHRIVQILVKRLIKASKETKIRHIALAGGVSANSGLRKVMLETGEKKNWTVYLPKLEYSTDNAAMVAVAGYYKFLKGEFSSQDVAPVARWAPGT